MDLISLGEGLDIVEREVREDEIGPRTAVADESPIVAVLRDGKLLRFDDPAAEELRRGDHLVCLYSHGPDADAR